MLFSTPFFLFVFLPIFFVLYWFLPIRRSILLLGSLIFYGWSEPVFLGVVLVSAAFDWILGHLLEKYAGRRRGKIFVGVGVAGNIAMLVYAKYTVFGVQNLNWLLTQAGWRVLDVPAIALPLGVSFIAFEKITYLVDIYRRVAKPGKSFLDYLNYVFLFPKLLAGPIVKYHDIADQLSRPSHRYEDVRDGTVRFVRGLAKKVLIADVLAPVADEVFKLNPGSVDAGTAWIGLLAFSLQIYFDFSGYSDMAIGLGRVLGFKLLENFHDPYLATSFTDFWRRWHISLSSWIREYLYIPLGGSRVSPVRSYINLCICFMLSGLWHGASWNFIIWGMFHGLILIVDRAFWLRWQVALPKVVNVVLTFFLVAIGWVFFRCEAFPHAIRFLGALFGQPSVGKIAPVLGNDALAGFIIGFIIVLLPALTPQADRRLAKPYGAGALAGAFFLLILCTGRMAVGTFQPFLYFRF
jgi:alginate O-acetyltransferase complex protein AlgI